MSGYYHICLGGTRREPTEREPMTIVFCVGSTSPQRPPTIGGVKLPRPILRPASGPAFAPSFKLTSWAKSKDLTCTLEYMVARIVDEINAPHPVCEADVSPLWNGYSTVFGRPPHDAFLLTPVGAAVGSEVDHRQSVPKTSPELTETLNTIDSIFGKTQCEGAPHLNAMRSSGYIRLACRSFFDSIPPRLPLNYNPPQSSTPPPNSGPLAKYSEDLGSLDDSTDPVYCHGARLLQPAGIHRVLVCLQQDDAVPLTALQLCTYNLTEPLAQSYIIRTFWQRHRVFFFFFFFFFCIDYMRGFSNEINIMCGI